MTRRQCLAAAAGLAGTGAARAQSLRRPWPRSRATPALRLVTLDGMPWDVAAWRGHPVLVNFWATWCGPCREEMRSLQAAAERHAAAGLRVVAVDFREPAATVRRFVDASGLALPVVLDADGAAAHALGVTVFPSTLALGRDGRVRFTVVGEADWTADAARRWIEQLLR